MDIAMLRMRPFFFPFKELLEKIMHIYIVAFVAATVVRSRSAHNKKGLMYLGSGNI
jgi:hypothetical protein